MKKLIAVSASAAMLAATLSAPLQAEARTKTVLKYGAIGLGAVALSQALQPNYGYSYPSYSYGYNSGYYPASSYYYNSYPSYGYSYPSYSYGYSSPSYGGYYGGYYY